VLPGFDVTGQDIVHALDAGNTHLLIVLYGILKKYNAKAQRKPKISCKAKIDKDSLCGFI